MSSVTLLFKRRGRCGNEGFPQMACTITDFDVQLICRQKSGLQAAD